MGTAVYRLTDLCVCYAGSGPGAAAALTDISLEVQRGEQVAVIGPSGAGKTTLLAALALALEPISGVIEAFGQQPWSLGTHARHALRGRLFLAPQVPPLPPRQRVITAVLAGRLPRWSLWRALHSLVYPHDASGAYAALRCFDLGDKLWSRVDRLSGGERQRVSLARMLIANTEAMLVDEPLSALDPRLAAQTLYSVQQAATQRGASLIASLHQVELAHAQFPRVIGLRDGRVLFDLPRERVNEALLRDLYAGRDEHASHPTSEPSKVVQYACA